jgi:hypothetical protein
MNKWLEHVAMYRSMHPEKSYKQCLKDAVASYKKPTKKMTKK